MSAIEVLEGIISHMSTLYDRPVAGDKLLQMHNVGLITFSPRCYQWWSQHARFHSCLHQYSTGTQVHAYGTAK